jgi:light-independent protochlorophyllide reductase subunit B
MRSMLERQRDFTPVTASIVDRHVLARGSQEKVVKNITRKDKEEAPNLILLTPTCTSSILQEDLQNFVNRASQGSTSDVLLADVNHYRVNELQAADRTLEQVVRFYIEKSRKDGTLNSTKTKYPSVNIIGTFTLGFHNGHDCQELKRLFRDLNICVNQVIPENGEVTQLNKLPQAWFNIVPYREVGTMAARYLEKEFNQPYISTTPMGIIDTNRCLEEISEVLRSCAYNLVASSMAGSELSHLTSEAFELFFENLVQIYESNISNYIKKQTHFISQAAWFSKSIDCQNLTGKKAVVVGDATHAASITKILVREMGIRVVCAGTYCKHDANWFREQVSGFCDQVLITDDNTQVSDLIAQLEPTAIFGTQMERHIGKRLDIPCGVISAPVHIQNFPLGYRPFLGYEGTNQIADLVYNSFTLGMEDHLLEIFGGHDTKAFEQASTVDESITNTSGLEAIYWTKESLKELSYIPSFVRSKVKRNTEQFAKENHLLEVTVEVMYKAKKAQTEG